MKQRLMDEQKLAAHGSELQHTIDQLSEETTRLRQALEVFDKSLPIFPPVSVLLDPCGAVRIYAPASVLSLERIITNLKRRFA